MKNLKMPIKVVPYEHQQKAFDFICKVFGILNKGGELIEKDEMYSVRKNVFKKGI